MMKRKSITLPEETIKDAEFVAKYLGKTLPSYIKKCIEAENQKRIKSIQYRLDEELHAEDLINLPQRWGNQSEVKKIISLLVDEALKNRAKKKREKSIENQPELLSGNNNGEAENENQ